ncbi:MAG: TetR/AcrR family transcriptional regulator [Parasphingopyxis sp.]|uniref:TetR/AcrR family transcriptional regulator n=1 Tax=Parasphingopyxis sp. TaxID=1920299 RepID=UPI0032EF67F3
MADSAETKPARRKRGTINKRLILDTSAGLFHEKGYDRTSLDDIAKALAVTKPSLYYHFPSKEDILLECVRTAYVKFEEEITRRDDLSLDGRRRAEIFLRLYLEIISNDIGVSMVLADDRVMSPEGRAQYNKWRRILNTDLEDRLKLGLKDGSIDAPETRLTTYAIFGMFNWVGHWNFRRQSMSLDEIFDRFISVAFDGIGSKA